MVCLLLSTNVHDMKFDQIKTTKKRLTVALWASLLSLTGMACAVAPHAVRAHDTDGQKPLNISIYTHGDTQFARFDENGNVTGAAQDWLSCAASELGFTYDFKFAPLSRATSLRQATDHMMWFPSSGADQVFRVGPVGALDILWYQLKTDDTEVSSPEFKQNAKVTSYTGSSFETMLQERGYQFVKGSADHNRLIYLLLSGTVDALLAVDFRFKLPSDVRDKIDEQVKTTVHRHIPVYFNLSKYMVEEHPELTKSLQSHDMKCNK